MELSYTDTFFRPLNPALAQLRQEAEAAKIPIIGRQVEMLLRHLLRLTKPQKILEIGTAVGYSASVFAATIDQANITTIESDLSVIDIAKENIAKLGYADRIEVCSGEGQTVLKQLADHYDFVFIDAAKSHYREFFDDAMERSKPGALIVCDNILYHGLIERDVMTVHRRYRNIVRNMQEFLTYINTLNRVETTIIDLGDGLSISTVIE